MKCRDRDCPCMAHVSPETHIPCCPHCRIPLVQSGASSDLGDCLNGRKEYGTGRCPARGANFSAEEWLWLERVIFHGEDMPPFNGWKPLEIPERLL